ncbi:MAG TPA: VWA domain-containing protein, partial [Opitutus sp.]|nr:VWA domain-containing protein [Opitutus sp.]
MTFAWPHLLWLALLPAAWLVWELTRARLTPGATHPKILRAEAGHHSLSLSPLASRLSPARATARPWLAAGLILAVAALARPQWGRIDEPVFDQSREILIAIDLSRSMLTPDVKPSRLDRAKLLVQSLLEKLKGERVGLIVFSGTAFLQSPLSSDYEILREFLPSLNPDFLPEGGTNYRALIDTSIDAFASATAADRFLIVLSDGEATDDNWRDRIPDLKKKNIRVIGLGVGTAAGAMIPDGAGGLVKDDRGAVVLSKLESGTLRELAKDTNGVYEDASSWIDLARLIDDTVAAGRKGKFTEKNSIRLVERFQWPLAFALWCLLVSFYYEFPVRPKPRSLTLARPEDKNPKSEDENLPPVISPPVTASVSERTRLAAARASKPAAASTLLFLLLSPFSLLPNDARATVPQSSIPNNQQPTTNSPSSAETASKADVPGHALGQIYSRLADQDKISARDYAEVAHETLRWGQRLKESGQPVIPGPVHDAIQAVDKLIAIDSK